MRWRDRVGPTNGILFFAGLFFMQCVYRFIRDESFTLTCADPDTCADPEFTASCDENGSLANFFVEIWGCDQVRLGGT